MPLSTADGKERAVKEVIMKVPSFSADYPKAPIYVADLVRCKECRHCYVDGEQVKFNACELNHNKVQSDDWFCADGEREGE